MILSDFANRFSEDAGIVRLMEDLGHAMADQQAGQQIIAMLGGGNPASIPQVQAVFQRTMQRIVTDSERFARMIGHYGPPQGDKAFITALAESLNRQYGWGISADHIALTAGSQSAFFILFNMLAGEFGDGRRKQILLPVIPEYIGYADVGLCDDLFTARRPLIRTGPDKLFKYHVDFDHLQIANNIGAICLSRPTNPTGNVVSDEELARLDALARAHKVPLIIDHAYGMPFPNIIFTRARPIWNENILLSMSLSKLGLPGMRTGIIVARPEFIRTIGNINGVINLALGNVGPALALDLLACDEMNRLCKTIIQPYYKAKMQRTVALIHSKLAGLNYYIHEPEGAIFLWLWLPDLPISSRELYQRLKVRGVLIIAGEHFFPGLTADWPHKQQCIRLSYAQHDAEVAAGIDIIADELKQLHGQITPASDQQAIGSP